MTNEFFGGSETWEALESEFYEESGIVDIVMSALDEVQDEKVVFDAHRGVCARLYASIRKWEPETVVATGVYSGVATASMLLALQENDRGTLYSVDFASGLSADKEEGNSTESETERALSLDYFERGRPSCAEVRSHEIPDDKEPGWIIPEELRDRWEYYSGRERAALPTLMEDVSDIGLFYHDSDHSTSGMLFEFELAFDQLQPGGIILSPHIDRNKAFDIFVNERECDHGVLHYDYLYSDEYDVPCSCGYVIK